MLLILGTHWSAVSSLSSNKGWGRGWGLDHAQIYIRARDLVVSRARRSKRGENVW